jgi:hypothetical protein
MQISAFFPSPDTAGQAHLYLFQHSLPQELVAAVHSEFLCEGPVPLLASQSLWKLLIGFESMYLDGAGGCSARRALSLENHILIRALTVAGMVPIAEGIDERTKNRYAARGTDSFL